MNGDMTVKLGDGILNIRVGAIIIKDGRILMVKNRREDWYYSVGGRVRMGEDSRQAVLREVKEELGTRLEIDRLGFVSENYFYGDFADGKRRLVYELGFYYYMKVPEGFEPEFKAVSDTGTEEPLEWVPLNTEKTLYPLFFKTELTRPSKELKHIVTDERIGS